MKHKVWGSFLGRTNAGKWFQGAKKAPPDHMFYKVSARVATKAGGHAKRLDLDKLLYAYCKGGFSTNRVARKSQFGQAIINVF